MGNPRAKFWARCLDAKAGNGGFFEALRHYHIFGVSVLAYIMQLAPVPVEFLNLERRAVQNLTRGPWHAIPGECMAALKDLGFPAEVRSLKLISQASMFRVAEACVNFTSLAKSISEDPGDREALLRPRTPDWHKDAIMTGLVNNRSYVQSVAPLFISAPLIDLQARLYKHLRTLQRSPWEALFLRRLGRHLPADEIRSSLVCSHFRSANGLLPPKVVWSALRVVCNGLPTSRRLQEAVLPCRLCGGDEGDCIEHLIHCGPLVIFLHAYFPFLSLTLGPVLGVSRAFLNRELSREELIATVAGHDLLAHCISALHLGGRDALPQEHLLARLRALCRKAPAIARLLRGAP
jgi:hypothetical protein